MKNLERDINNLIFNSQLPILASGISYDNFSNKVIINADIEHEKLSVIGTHPAWLVNLEFLSKKNEISLLIINNIDTLTTQQQNKFLQLLKYRSVSGYKIPDNAHIILICDNLDKVSNEIKSFCAIVKAGEV